MDDVKTLLPILSILIALASIMFTYFGLVLKIRDDMSKDKAEIKDDISNINIHLANLGTKIDLFWKCIESKAVDLLKSYPTHKEKDVLLDKLKERSLSVSDAELLRTILSEEMKSSEKDKFCYILILGRLEQILYDLRQEVNRGQSVSNNT